MVRRFIVIDTNRDYRSLIANHISVRWRDAKIAEYDPTASGRLPDSFSGAGNDVVLLGHPLGDESALDWLRKFKHIRNFPPVLFIGSGDEREIVQAMKQGATDYISKPLLKHANLISILESMLDMRDGPLETSQPLPVGDLQIPGLRNYQLERCISGGDVSSVYLAHQKNTGTSVVLKVLRQVPDFATDDKLLDRFLVEFDLIGKIKHPNIVEIFDLGVADNHAFIAMEYCSRGSLKGKIKRGLSPEQSLQILRDIADALRVIHEVGILHRDLKPTNVLFREDDSLALIDFGLAKQAHLKAELTGTGEIFGTPYYMSPEQGHGDDLDVRSDIYSLGIILYEMLSGSKPFEGSTAMSVIMKHARDPIPRLPPDVAHYQPAIDRMLAKEPAHRFQTIEDVLAWEPVTA